MVAAAVLCCTLAAERAFAQPIEVELEALLTFAQTHSPMLQLAEARRGYAQAARAAAAPLFASNPALQLNIGPRFDPRGTSGLDFTAVLGQPIELAGQRGVRGELADRTGGRVDAELTLARWELRRQVSEAYRAAIVAREQVRVSDQLLTFASDMANIAQRRFGAGELSVIDRQIADSDVAQARQAKLLAEQAVRDAQLTLCELTGWPIERLPVPRGALTPPAPVPTLERVLAQAAARHPELASKQAAVEEARARVTLAERDASPSPTLGIQVAREAHRAGDGEGVNYIVLGSIGLSLPVWQRNQEERARARTDQAVAQGEHSATTLVLRVRIAKVHAQLLAAAERLRLFSAEIAPSLESSLALLRRGLEAGELPIVDVAVARERFLQTQRDALDAYGAYYRALAELEYLAGAPLYPTEAAR
ncbi:MAG: TolC family protein [Polyangiales bacterium]